MKINFILPFLDKTGGILVVIQHAYHLTLRGHDVTVYYPLYPYKEGWFTSTRIKRILGPFKEFLRSLLRYRRRLPWYPHPFEVTPVPWIGNLTIRDADVTIATAYPTAYSVHRLKASKGRKFYFIQGYECAKIETSGKWITDAARVNASFDLPLELISIAPNITLWLQSDFGRKAKAEVHNGIDLSVFFPPPAKKWEDLRILMISHILDVKGTPDGLKTLQDVHRRFPAARCVLFGMFPPPNHLPDYIEFHRDPPLEIIVKLYQESHIFLSPSLREGWHLPPMEAMACQCAVVATKVGSIPTLYDGKNLMATEPGDWQGMADNIVFLLEHPEECKAMALRGYQTIKGYTLERAAAKLEKTIL